MSNSDNNNNNNNNITNITKMPACQRRNQPPFPYNNKYQPVIRINGHYYCIDSSNYKGNPKSPWTKKYLYYHTNIKEDQNTFEKVTEYSTI